MAIDLPLCISKHLGWLGFPESVKSENSMRAAPGRSKLGFLYIHERIVASFAILAVKVCPESILQLAIASPFSLPVGEHEKEVTAYQHW